MYKEKFNKDLGGYSAPSYDATNILINAIKNAKSIDGELIAKEIAKTKDFEGVSGTITFDEKGDLTSPGFVLSKVIDGKFVVINE